MTKRFPEITAVLTLENWVAESLSLCLYGSLYSENQIYTFNWVISQGHTIGMVQIKYLGTWLTSFPPWSVRDLVLGCVSLCRDRIVGTMCRSGIQNQGLGRAQGFVLLLELMITWGRVWDLGCLTSLISCYPESEAGIEGPPLEWLCEILAAWGKAGHSTPSSRTLHTTLQTSPAAVLVLTNVCPQWALA